MNRFILENLKKRQDSLTNAIMEAEDKTTKLINTNFEDNHGIVLSGGQNTLHIHFDNNGMSVEQEPQQPKQYLDPAITLLDVEVRAKLDANAEPKYVLLPAKAAKEAYVPLPFSNEVQFNARYNANISHATWSRWMNDTGKNGYEEKELAAYINKFTNL